VSGELFWLWVVICLLGWVAAVFLIAAWLDHDDDLDRFDLDGHKWPTDHQDGDW
jgi:hypothetical protein